MTMEALGLGGEEIEEKGREWRLRGRGKRIARVRVRSPPYPSRGPRHRNPGHGVGARPWAHRTNTAATGKEDGDFSHNPLSAFSFSVFLLK